MLLLFATTTVVVVIRRLTGRRSLLDLRWLLVRGTVRMLVGGAQREVPPPLTRTRAWWLHLLVLMHVLLLFNNSYSAIVGGYVILGDT